MIEAKVLAHTKNLYSGDEVITFQCTYHRFILPEVNTYRNLSRNSASSRGIPVLKKIEEVRNNPAIPVSWGENQRGMVAKDEVPEEDKAKAIEIWRNASAQAISVAEELFKLKIHKQIVNRVLEPFCWQTSVITGMKEWFEHMFNQRIHPDAQPEFRELAIKMRNALLDSVPKTKTVHLPYILPEEESLPISKKMMASVARCARVSYTPFNGDSPNVEEDLQLFKRLVMADPPHFSPLEHVLIPDENEYSQINYHNFKRFISFRWVCETFGEDLNYDGFFEALDDGYKWFE